MLSWAYRTFKTLPVLVNIYFSHLKCWSIGWIWKTLTHTVGLVCQWTCLALPSHDAQSTLVFQTWDHGIPTVSKRGKHLSEAGRSRHYAELILYSWGKAQLLLTLLQSNKSKTMAGPQPWARLSPRGADWLTSVSAGLCSTKTAEGHVERSRFNRTDVGLSHAHVSMMITILFLRGGGGVKRNVSAL